MTSALAVKKGHSGRKKDENSSDVDAKKWVVNDNDTELSLFEQEVRGRMPITYDFELDDFQKRAVRRVHRHQGEYHRSTSSAVPLSGSSHYFFQP